MNKLLERFTVAACLSALAILLVTVFAASLPDAQAQIRNVNPTPSLFQDYTGTNWIGFNGSAGMEVRTGGTIYTGITTNMQMYGGATNSMRLVIVNGVIVGTTAY